MEPVNFKLSELLDLYDSINKNCFSQTNETTPCYVVIAKLITVIDKIIEIENLNYNQHYNSHDNIRNTLLLMDSGKLSVNMILDTENLPDHD